MYFLHMVAGALVIRDFVEAVERPLWPRVNDRNGVVAPECFGKCDRRLRVYRGRSGTVRVRVWRQRRCYGEVLHHKFTIRWHSDHRRFKTFANTTANIPPTQAPTTQVVRPKKVTAKPNNVKSHPKSGTIAHCTRRTCNRLHLPYGETGFACATSRALYRALNCSRNVRGIKAWLQAGNPPKRPRVNATAPP